MHIDQDIKEKVTLLFELAGPSMVDTLGIEYQSFKKDEIIATMPVDENTIQPFGILHGGASVTLAETLASVGGWLNLEDEDMTAVGVEINANHIRSVSNGGRVTGTAMPVHLGRKIQVWQITITDERDRLVCTSRCTLAVAGLRKT